MAFNVKSNLNGELHRFALKTASYEELRQTLCDVYHYSDFVVKYTDDDGDLVSLSSTPELVESYKVIQPSTVLRLTVVPAKGAARIQPQLQPSPHRGGARTPSSVDDQDWLDVETPASEPEPEASAAATALEPEASAQKPEHKKETFAPEPEQKEQPVPEQKPAKKPFGGEDLKPASRGNNVLLLQAKLCQQGLRVGPVDGVFGRWTSNAVALFQKRRGLPVTGVADAATLKALDLEALDLEAGVHRASAGNHVRELQISLARAGAAPGPIDGLYGLQTSNAVRRFQEAKGLLVSGVADEATRAALPRPTSGSLVTSASDLLASLTELFTDASVRGALGAAIRAAHQQALVVMDGSNGEEKGPLVGVDSVVQAFLGASEDLARHSAVRKLEWTATVLLAHLLSMMPPQLARVLQRVDATALNLETIDFERLLPFLPQVVAFLSPVLSALNRGETPGGMGLGLPAFDAMFFLPMVFRSMFACQRNEEAKGCGEEAAASAAQADTEAAAPAAPQVVTHYGIVCDGCQACPIKGARFKSTVLPDYDLCEKCEAKGIHPDPMIKMRVPAASSHGRCPMRRGGPRGFGFGGGGLQHVLSTLFHAQPQPQPDVVKVPMRPATPVASPTPAAAPEPVATVPAREPDKPATPAAPASPTPSVPPAAPREECKEYADQLASLSAMGFMDEAALLPLLRKWTGNINRVVQELFANN